MTTKMWQTVTVAVSGDALLLIPDPAYQSLTASSPDEAVRQEQQRLVETAPDQTAAVCDTQRPLD